MCIVKYHVFDNVESCLYRIRFRCVKSEDKSLSLGFAEVVLALLAFMPGPVLYGTIVGKYTKHNNIVTISGVFFAGSRVSTPSLPVEKKSFQKS